jgi:hypothetical protein
VGVVPALVVAPQVVGALVLVVGARGWEGAAQAVVLVLVLGVVPGWAPGEGRAAVDSSNGSSSSRSSSSKQSRCSHCLVASCWLLGATAIPGMSVAGCFGKHMLWWGHQTSLAVPQHAAMKLFKPCYKHQRLTFPPARKHTAGPQAVHSRVWVGAAPAYHQRHQIQQGAGSVPV